MSDLAGAPLVPYRLTSPGLRERAVRGMFWVVVSTASTRLLQLGTNVVLARLLAPRQFGAFAVATIVINGLLLLNDLGVGTALVYHQGDRDVVASTAFFLLPILGFVVAGAGVITAPLTARALGDATAVGIVRLLSVSVFFSSIAVVPSMLLEKDLAFRRKVLAEVAPVMAFSVTAIVGAGLLGAGAYSLATAEVVQSAGMAVLFWLACPWRPRWTFDTAAARSLLGYGKHVLFGAVIVFFATNMDNGFVSRVAGERVLGTYVLAYSIANIPATEVGDVVGRVLFPSFVQLNNRLGNLRSAYAQSLRALAVITAPLLAGMSGVATPFVLAVFGRQWAGMIRPLEILPIFAALRVVSGVTGNLFLAAGRPRYNLMIGLVGVPVQAALLWFFVAARREGAFGAAVAVTIASVIALALVVYLTSKVLTIDFFAAAGTALQFAAAAGACYLASRVTVRVVALSPATDLVMGAVSGTVAYLVSLFLVGGGRHMVDVVDLLRRHEGRTGLAG